jgi:hypothetical protein
LFSEEQRMGGRRDSWLLFFNILISIYQLGGVRCSICIYVYKASGLGSSHHSPFPPLPPLNHGSLFKEVPVTSAVFVAGLSTALTANVSERTQGGAESELRQSCWTPCTTLGICGNASF